MKVYTYTNNFDFSSNTYLLSNNDHCLLIDCGFTNNEMLNKIKEHTFFDGIILTHKHFDHIKGLEYILSLFPNIKIYSHNTKDKFMDNPFNNCSSLMYKREVKISCDILNLNEGINNLDNFNIQVFYTAGHTSDSIIIKIGNYLFTGDTLFFDGLGRCDLPTSNYYELNKSIEIIKKIINEEKVEILPGHGISTNSDKIKKYNLYIR